MPIDIQPFESGTLLRYRFSGRLTIDDFIVIATAEEPYFHALGKDDCLNIIADLTDLETISPTLFTDIQHMRMFSDGRVCRVIIVGANPYLRALAISLGLLTPNSHFTFRNSYDEELHLLGTGGNGRHQPGKASGKAT